MRRRIIRVSRRFPWWHSHRLRPGLPLRPLLAPPHPSGALREGEGRSSSSATTRTRSRRSRRSTPRARSPGFEQRSGRRLLPGLLFYKGASLAALGGPKEAEAAFEAFLAIKPNVELDPGAVSAEGRHRRAGRRPKGRARRDLETGGDRRHRDRVPGLRSARVRSLRGAAGRTGRRAGQVASDLRTAEDVERPRRLARALGVHRGVLEVARSEARDARERVPRRVRAARRVRGLRFFQDETRGLADRSRHGLHPARAADLQRPEAAGTGDEAGAADSSGQSRYGRAEQSMAEHGRSGTSKTAQINEVTGAGLDRRPLGGKLDRDVALPARGSCRRTSHTRSSPRSS